jgi:TDG/mug DNA glycosylase family protein
VIAPDLRVLFCGINPGLYSAATGNHFARPGNRFWPALHAAGFTPKLLHPSEKSLLLEAGYGLTNLVNRATAAADELSAGELVSGGKQLARKISRYRPRTVAFLGLGAYRHAFGRPKATLGRQPGMLEGALVWALPSPSGLNANYQLPQLVELFRDLRKATGQMKAANEEATIDRALRRAIAGRRLIRFTLDGALRIAEPHDYGEKDGVETVLLYQLEGPRRGNRPSEGWRQPPISKLSEIEILDDRFRGPRPAKSGQHVRWDKLFASVSREIANDE